MQQPLIVFLCWAVVFVALLFYLSALRFTIATGGTALASTVHTDVTLILCAVLLVFGWAIILDFLLAFSSFIL